MVYLFHKGSQDLLLGLSWCFGCNLFCTHQVADDIITCHNTFSCEA